MPTDDTTAEVALDVLSVVAHGAFGFLAGAVLSLLVGAFARIFIRRRQHLKPFSRRLRSPMRIIIIICGVGVGVLIAIGGPTRAQSVEWAPVFFHVWTILLILSGAYLLSGLISAIADSLLLAHADAQETVYSRRLRTQTQVISRVGVAVVWVLAISGVLLTFEQFRAIGASMLASAGLLSIVAGLAAQSSLANVFAGVQLAFTDALRVGDIVIVDEHLGTIEEITLTYVVVASWDGRRWIVPSTVFISKTFENWTRSSPKLLGTVEFDLDWLVPVEAARVELQRIVRRSDLWDGRTVSMQVTEATGGYVKLRATVSAATSGDLWDLRCYVREELITWLQQRAVYALPRTRLEPDVTPAPSIEERKQFVAETKAAWDDERADDTTEKIPVADLFDDDDDVPSDSFDARRRTWFKALRDRSATPNGKKKPGDRQRPQLDALISSVLRPSKTATPETPTPPDDGPHTAEMPSVEVTDGRGDSLSVTARVFSGTPEAEERNRKYAGPSKEDLEEREARRKERETQEHDDELPKSGDWEES
ncbi:mechanosensitive ion channel family protein [uncultured Tessaracoccus sp.]|uniref:mechanosensitive ion channel family protein n=1 Tax=uncultured Tessaracoccus sp. TaxID=905023 RepID=UPI002612C92B|nr:mechanosensitive ion channel family protein [uncultured Tessaracoccus sp.]